jgi:hypothetical protein
LHKNSNLARLTKCLITPLTLYRIDRSVYKRIATGGDSSSQKDLRQIRDLLWSNPVRIEEGKVRPTTAKKTIGCFYNDHTNMGCLFGVDVTSAFCKANNFSFIVRSHQVREKGFQEDHLRCFTLCSASNYLESNNYGAIVKLGPRDSQLESHVFKNYINVSKSSQNSYVIRKFKRLIQLNKRVLLEKVSLIRILFNMFVNS